MADLYFRHYINASKDPRLQELRMKIAGGAGLGVYWLLWETLASTTSHILSTDYNKLGWELHLDSGMIKRVVCEFGLFTLTEDGSGFYSEELSKQLQEEEAAQTEKNAYAEALSQARREAGRRGGLAKAKNANPSKSLAKDDFARENPSKSLAKDDFARNIPSKSLAKASKTSEEKEKEVEQEKESNNNTRTLFTRDEVINNNINNNLLKKESVKERKISLANIDVVEDADGGIYHLEDSTRDVLARLLEVFQKRDPKRLDIRPMELQALMKLRSDIGTRDADEQILGVLDQFDALPVFQPGGKFQGWNMLTLLKYKNFDMVKSGMFNAQPRQDAPISRQGYGTMHTKVEQPVDDIPF